MSKHKEIEELISKAREREASIFQVAFYEFRNPKQISEFFRQYIAYFNDKYPKEGGKQKVIEDMKYCFRKNPYFHNEGVNLWKNAIPELKASPSESF